MASAVQNPSRDHHFVPRSVLRRFSVGRLRKQVWVYDKTTGRRFTARIGDAGSANDDNKLRLTDGGFLNFEPTFDDIDGVFPQTGDRLSHRPRHNTAPAWGRLEARPSVAGPTENRL